MICPASLSGSRGTWHCRLPGGAAHGGMHSDRYGHQWRDRDESTDAVLAAAEAYREQSKIDRELVRLQIAEQKADGRIGTRKTRNPSPKVKPCPVAVPPLQAPATASTTPTATPPIPSPSGPGSAAQVAASTPRRRRAARVASVAPTSPAGPTIPEPSTPTTIPANPPPVRSASYWPPRTRALWDRVTGVGPRARRVHP